MASNNRYLPLAGLSSESSTPTVQPSPLPQPGPFITANEFLAYEEVVNEPYIPTPPENVNPPAVAPSAALRSLNRLNSAIHIFPNPPIEVEALNRSGSEEAAMIVIAQETYQPSEEALNTSSSYHPVSVDIAAIAAQYTLPDSVPPSPAGQAEARWSPSALQPGSLPHTPRVAHENLSPFQGYRDSAPNSPDSGESTPKLSPVVIHFHGLATTNTNTPTSPVTRLLHDITTIPQETHTASSLICRSISVDGEDQIGDLGLTLTSGFELGPYDAASHMDPSPVERVPVVGNPMPPIPETVESQALPLPGMPTEEESVVEGDLNMLGPDSPESEERMVEYTPDVPIWDDTQEREARERLEACRPIASTLGPFPTEADLVGITDHTGDLALDAMDRVLVDLEPNWLQLAHYVQRDNIFPVAGGLDIASDEGINAAFKIAAAALSTGFGRPGYEWSHVLYAKNWFRGAIIVTTVMTRGILSSQDFHHQGMKLLDPCPDELVHLPSINRPEYFLDLLREVAGQFKGELLFKDYVIGSEPDPDIFTTWATLRKGMIKRLDGLARESVQKDIAQWKETFLKGLKTHAVGEAVDMLMARLEDEHGVEQQTYLLDRARELRDRALKTEANWEAEFCKKARTQAEAEITAGAALWKEQEGLRLNDQIQKDLTLWATTELEARKKFMLNEMFQNELACAKAEQIKAAQTMARGMYDTFLTEEQHKLWPEVPELAQQGGFEEALSAEREKLYRGIREQANREVREEVAAYKANRIATTIRDRKSTRLNSSHSS